MNKLLTGLVLLLCAGYGSYNWYFSQNDYEDGRIMELGFYDNSEEQAELRKMKQCPYDGPYVQDYHAYCAAPVFLEVECRLKSAPLEEKERENLLLEKSCQIAINDLSQSRFFVPFDSKQSIDVEKFDNDNLKAKVVLIFDPPEQREEVETKIEYKSIKAVFSDFMGSEEFVTTSRNFYGKYVTERQVLSTVLNALEKYTRNKK